VEHCVSSASFEKLSRGRERGQEDVTSFYRKGVAGDWKNFFTERDKQIYKEEAGELLIRLGYENDHDW
jgi:Sulfotransferase domain